MKIYTLPESHTGLSLFLTMQLVSLLSCARCSQSLVIFLLIWGRKKLSESFCLQILALKN